MNDYSTFVSFPIFWLTNSSVSKPLPFLGLAWAYFDSAYRDFFCILLVWSKKGSKKDGIGLTLCNLFWYTQLSAGSVWPQIIWYQLRGYKDVIWIWGFWFVHSSCWNQVSGFYGFLMMWSKHWIEIWFSNVYFLYYFLVVIFLLGPASTFGLRSIVVVAIVGFGGWYVAGIRVVMDLDCWFMNFGKILKFMDHVVWEFIQFKWVVDWNMNTEFLFRPTICWFWIHKWKVIMFGPGWKSCLRVDVLLYLYK